MRGLVVFDLDGTLAETAPDIMATLNRLLVSEGLAELPVSKARDLLGIGARVLIQRGFEAAGAPLTPERLEQLFAHFLVDYLDRVAEGSHLFEGCLEALDTLQARGYGLAVCTNKPEPHSRKLLAALKVETRFRFIAGRETFAFCKPDPRHLTETIRLAGGDMMRTVMVGDSRTDIDTARAAAVKVIGVPFGYTNVPIEALQPDLVVPHFSGMVAAVESLIG